MVFLYLGTCCWAIMEVASIKFWQTFLLNIGLHFFHHKVCAPAPAPILLLLLLLLLLPIHLLPPLFGMSDELEPKALQQFPLLHHMHPLFLECVFSLTLDFTGSSLIPCSSFCFAELSTMGAAAHANITAARCG